MDIVTLSLARKYVEETAKGLGAVKGSPCTIKSITEGENGSTVVFAWTGADGAEQTSTTFLPRGPKGKEGDPGEPGVSPTAAVSAIDGGHRVTITDATGTHTFDVLDGEPGKDGSGVDTEAREQIAALSEEIEALKGGGGTQDFTVSFGYWDSSGNMTGQNETKAMHTSLIAAADVASAHFISPMVTGENRYVVLFDENENFIKRLSRNKTDDVYVLIPGTETTPYTYFAVAWYSNGVATEDAFRGIFKIEWATTSETNINTYVKNDVFEYKCAMPKWADIHPWVAFDGVTNAEVNEADFNAWYGRFHALTETYPSIGLEEINMSTDYLAANTDDNVPEAISSITNGGMYMWHLPAPGTDGGGFTVKHKTPKIIIVSGQHGDETSAVWCVWKLLDALCRNDTEYRAITLLRNFCDIYVIPLANPYGVEEFTRGNENGININRDYSVPNWVTNTGETGAPTAENSQYSTRCISWWVEQIAPDGLIDYHSSFGSDTMESGKFVQWGGSPIPAVTSLVESNIMDVTPYIRKNLAPKFDAYQHWFGHTSESTDYRKRQGMITNFAYYKGIMAATYEVVRRVQWDDVYILSGDDEPAICAMNYHGIVNFAIKFVQMVVETLNSGIEWRAE